MYLALNAWAASLVGMQYALLPDLLPLVASHLWRSAAKATACAGPSPECQSALAASSAEYHVLLAGLFAH